MLKGEGESVNMFGFVEVFLQYALEKIFFLSWAVRHCASPQSFLTPGAHMFLPLEPGHAACLPEEVLDTDGDFGM